MMIESAAFSAACLCRSTAAGCLNLCDVEKVMLYDKDIREPLFDFLEASYGKIRFLEEQPTGKSRADIVMVVPGALYGIEIKSDADTYVRLKRQIPDYDRYYDYNLVVVGTTHAAHIEEHVPDWWGIITVEQEEGRADFYFLRQPKPNPKMEWNCKIEILWRPELAHIQELNRMYAYRQKSKRFVADKIVETVEGSCSPNRCLRSCSSATIRRSGRRFRTIGRRTAKSQGAGDGAGA